MPAGLSFTLWLFEGTADQYVRDYSRIFGLRTVVFRMSCQYGTRQFGNEDQGWVVHFVIAAHFGRTINVYGDGRQVRDILFIDDLVRAFRAATDRIEDTKGRIFNIGGGPANVMSLLELVELLQKITGRTLELQFGDWRPGDQKVYASNIARRGSLRLDADRLQDRGSAKTLRLGQPK